MAEKIVYQTDTAGHYCGDTVADESPLEPGVYLLPAGCVSKKPPKAWPADKWPRWTGRKWELINKPVAADETVSAVDKLADFLAANPDVAALLNK